LSTNAIARRYAKALIQVAAGQGTVEQYFSELEAFSKALVPGEEAAEFFEVPSYGIEAKREIVKELASRLGASRTIRDFMLLLLDKKRLDQLDAILESYRSFADEAAGILRSAVISAVPLSEEQVAELRRTLEKATGKKVILSVSADPRLIGGVVTRIGDKVFDGSIRTQLTKIQDILQKG
jgi:F-type H+-transporting ATPase subunit delta